ncbi:MAG: hypothetical protein ACREVK_02500 [Gammaproteobacteria bacterium]
MKPILLVVTYVLLDDEVKGPHALHSLLRPYPAGRMTADPISMR